MTSDRYADRLTIRLVQAQKMELIGRITGGIAHDFNNLLTGILGYTSLLKTSIEPATEEHEAVLLIETAARRAAGMTKQLLAYSQRGPAVAHPFASHDVIHEAVEILARTINKKVRTTTELGAANSTIVGDPGTLFEALLHMGVNASDAMPDGGELTFSTSNFSPTEAVSIQDVPVPPGEYLRLRISDTGKGIPGELRDKIFEPFFTTKDPGKGTGLGLAMAYGWVKSHKGFIFLDSEEGRGTVFTILLPLAVAAEGHAEPIPSEKDLAARIGKAVAVDEEVPLGSESEVFRLP